MKKLKTAVSVALILSMLFSMCGCSFRFTDFNNLIRPPKSSGKYQGLQESFEKSVGSEFTLITPESGDYKSAFVAFDINNDKIDEALVFYSDKQSDVAKFCYFNYIDEEWILAANIDGLGNAVDKVVFTDFDSDGSAEIIIGWNLFSSKTNKVFAAYDTDDSDVGQISSYPYTFFDVLDADGDDCTDVLTLTVDSSVPEQLTALATVYKYNFKNSVLASFGEVSVDGNISSYNSVVSETVDDTQFIYVESSKGQNESITELLYIDAVTGNLIAPLFDVASQSTISTWRNISITSYDIDKDGFLEIPTSVEMPGSAVVSSSTLNSDYSQLSDEMLNKNLYFTKWVKYRDGKLEPVQYSVINSSMGYILNIKSSWVGRISVVDNDGQWDFYRWDSNKNEIVDLLFTIYAYDATDETEKQYYSSYTELGSNGEKNFVYQITESGQSFGIKDGFLKENFIINNFGGIK